MDNTIEVHLKLTRDTPSSMNLKDTYSGLDRIWYKFEAEAGGNVTLRANADGFEHLARYFLKMARSGKGLGYHAHHTAEFGGEPGSQPELTIIIGEPPAGFFGPG